MASKDAMYDAKMAAKAKAATNANAIKQVGPLGGLGAGVVAGVKVNETVNPVQAEMENSWVPAGIVQTVNGPVDVDANGVAQDGTVPIAASEEFIPEKKVVVEPKIISTYTDPTTGDIIDVYDDKTEKIRRKGTLQSAAATAAADAAAKNLAGRVSAYDILYAEFDKLGLGSLVSDVKQSIINSQSASERTIALRNSKAYQKRFAANAKRVANGFAAIDEATYLGLEDKYQQIAQNYGLPAKYYTRGELGVQQYFEDAIAKNINPITFEERIMEGQKVLNANKLVLDTAKKFYPDLNDGDFLDFVLNPSNAISDIKRKVSASEIGAAQRAAGLQATKMGAEALVGENITGARYQAAAPTIAEASIRGGQLASIYNQDPYTQQTAEQAVLNTLGSAEAIKQTKKLTELERASFLGQSGRGAIARERAGLI